MIPHNQTFVGNGDEGAIPGNCMQAAVASLLDMELGAVPHFALFDYSWRSAINVWLGDHGKSLRIFTDDKPERESWEAVSVNVSPLNFAPSDQMMLASGQSHNGPWKHLVVWKSGALAHDPNPNRKGIKGEPFEYWQIEDVT